MEPGQEEAAAKDIPALVGHLTRAGILALGKKDDTAEVERFRACLGR